MYSMQDDHSVQAAFFVILLILFKWNIFEYCVYILWAIDSQVLKKAFVVVCRIKHPVTELKMKWNLLGYWSMTQWVQLSHAIIEKQKTNKQKRKTILKYHLVRDIFDWPLYWQAYGYKCTWRPWSCEIGVSRCPWRRQFSGCFVPSLRLLLPACCPGWLPGLGWRHLSLRPGANSLFAFISFLISFRAFFESLSVREAIHLHLPGWPRNSRITWHSVKKYPVTSHYQKKGIFYMRYNNEVSFNGSCRYPNWL